MKITATILLFACGREQNGLSHLHIKIHKNFLKVIKWLRNRRSCIISLHCWCDILHIYEPKHLMLDIDATRSFPAGTLCHIKSTSIRWPKCYILLLLYEKQIDIDLIIWYHWHIILASLWYHNMMSKLYVTDVKLYQIHLTFISTKQWISFRPSDCYTFDIF